MLTTGCSPSAPPLARPDHLAMARRISRRYTSLDHTPEDLHQEAVLALLDASARYGDDPPRLESAARSHLSRLVRKSNRQRSRYRPLDDTHADTLPSPGETAIAHEVWTHARDVLPARQAAVLEMTADGDSDSEIAAELGIGESAVRMARSRAVAVLREMFA